MVFRFIMRYFANNEQLVQRLSDSYPIRAAARFVVSLFNRGKNMIEEHDLDKKVTPDKIKRMARRFSDNLKEEVKQAKDEFKRRNK